MTKTTIGAIAAAALALSACSSESTSKNSDDIGADDGGSKGDDSDSGAAGHDAEATETQFDELLAYDWTLTPGEENYYCVFETLTEELWVNEYRPISPPGTHHVSVGYVGKPGEPVREDGVVPNLADIVEGVPCTGTSLGERLAFGGLVGTQKFAFPEGVGVKIPAGQQIMLSVHVSNTTDEPLSGRTGIAVHRSEPVPVEKQAELVFVNNVFLNVTPGKTTQKGTCTLDADSTFITLLHHMHETGTHMATRAIPVDGDPTVLLDADYSFTDQTYEPIDPGLFLKKGDKLEVTCDYENPTSRTYTFGESTFDNEMCIAIMYRYPASAVNFNCIASP